MKTLKFKTNINCGGCVATVTPFLEKIKGVKWKVNTDDKDKILEVSGDEISSDDITRAVKEAGFKIEPLESGIFGKLFN